MQNTFINKTFTNVTKGLVMLHNKLVTAVHYEHDNHTVHAD